MKRALIGIVVASIVLYLYGFLYWGMGPYRQMIWKQPKNEEAARTALREHFPKEGTYFVPSYHSDDHKARKANHEQGPIAFVHMLRVSGRPEMDVSIMVGGFVLNLIVIVLIALLLRQTAHAFPGYLQRIGFIALTGLTASLLIDCGDIVWWQMPIGWKVYQAIYGFTFWVIAALILSPFVSRQKHKTL
jgi:hypothetical protein